MILLSFFQRPAQSFIDAAKQCSVDNLCGSLDAIAWGKEPFNGTSGPFEIMHSGKVCMYSKHDAIVTDAQYFPRYTSIHPQKLIMTILRGLGTSFTILLCNVWSLVFAGRWMHYI